MVKLPGEPRSDDFQNDEPQLVEGPTIAERPTQSADIGAALGGAPVPAPSPKDDLYSELERLGGGQDNLMSGPVSEQGSPLFEAYKPVLEDMASGEEIKKQAAQVEAKAASSAPPERGPSERDVFQRFRGGIEQKREEIERYGTKFNRNGSDGRVGSGPQSLRRFWSNPGSYLFMNEQDYKATAELELKNASRALDSLMQRKLWQQGEEPTRESKALDEEIQKAQERVQHAEDVVAGKKLGRSLQMPVEIYNRIGRGVVSDTYGNLLQGIGAGAGYLGKNVAGMDVSAHQNKLAEFGRWIEAKGHELYPTDPERAQDFSSKLAQGAGSFLGIYGVGGISKVMGASDRTLGFVVALTGSQITGASTLKDAWESQRQGRDNTSDWDKFNAYLMGSLLGTTESIPIVQTLGKFGRGGILGRTLEGMIEEGTQEGGVTLGENLIANWLVGHDPERPTMQGVAESVAIGAILGGGMNAAMGAASRGSTQQAGQTTPTRDEDDEAPATPEPEPATPPAPAAPARSSVEIGTSGQSVPTKPVRAGLNTEPEVVTPDGSISMPVQTVLVELEDLVHATGDLQPRDRSRKESDEGVRFRAANLDPLRLLPERVSDGGAPVITQDGTIVSGNGRVMSIREVYTSQNLSDRAQTYRSMLGGAAEGMKHPVLVRKIQGNPDAEELLQFADRSNRPAVAQMSATERASRDAKAAGAEVMQLYQGGSFDAPQNREFLRAFVQKAVTPAERGAMAKDGLLTKEGEDRLNAAVLASAYGDPEVLQRMLESRDDNIRNITGALRDVSGLMLELQQSIASGQTDPAFDITPQISEAARRIADMRSNNVSPADALAQQDAFTQMDPLVEAMIRGFYNENLTRPISRQKMTALLTLYANEAKKHSGQEGLIPDETTPQDVLDISKRNVSEAGEVVAEVSEAAAAVGDLVTSDLFGDGTGADGGTDAGAGRGQPGPATDRGGQAARSQDGTVNTDEIAAKVVPEQRAFFEETFGPQEDLGTEPTAEQRSAFAEVLAGTAPRRQWQELVGATPEQIEALEREAVNQGALRITKTGQLRRTGQAKPASIAPTVAIPADARLDNAIAAREAEGAIITQPIAEYAWRVELVRGDVKKVQALIEEINNDKSFDKSDVLELAHLVGYAPKSRTTKAQALESIVQRSKDLADIRDLDILPAIKGDAREAPPPVPGGMALPRTSANELGFYSQAIRAAQALKQKRGTPEQMLAQLKKGGIKQAEIEATGLDKFLEGEKSVTKDGIVAFLELNNVEVLEATYQAPRELVDIKRDLDEATVAANEARARFDEGVEFQQQFMQLEQQRQRLANEHQTFRADEYGRIPKWSEYSLDPSNPTYRETVLHLPSNAKSREAQALLVAQEAGYADLESAAKSEGFATVEEFVNRANESDVLIEADSALDFRSGHFDEPNIISHIRTSIQPDAEGKTHYVLNELQSDWGQAVRDRGGARDEAKIAELRNEIDTLRKAVAEQRGEVDRKLKELAPKLREEGAQIDETGVDPELRIDWQNEDPIRVINTIQDYVDDGIIQELPGPASAEMSALLERFRGQEGARLPLAEAELRTAEQAAPGHPLVATTDQWVNTSLRRFLRQAIESGSDYVTIASGETVDSFGMGAPLKGLQYAYNEMYPKKLRDIIKKIDKDAAKPEQIAALKEYNTEGSDALRRDLGAGAPENVRILDTEPKFGFTRFPITDKLRKAVLDQGQPLFRLGAEAPVRPEFEAVSQQWAEDVAAYARQLLPADVAVRISDTMPGGMKGSFEPIGRVVELSMEVGPTMAMQTARHEAIHAARISGLWTKEEWKILTERAKKIGAEPTIIDRDGDVVSAMPRYEDLYSARAAELYPRNKRRQQAWVREHLNQERVATLAESYASGKASYGSKINALLDRIANLLQAMVNAARGLGFQTANDIFARMERGEIAARGEPQIAERAPESTRNDFMVGDAPGEITTREMSDGGRIRIYKTDDETYAGIKESQNGSWSVQMLNAPDSDTAEQLYQAVEDDIGQYLSPDGWLTPQAYEYWLATDPASVEGHQETGALFYGMYVPPGQVDVGVRALEQVATQSTGVQQRQARQKAQALRTIATKTVLPAMRGDIPQPVPLGQGTATEKPSKTLSDLVQLFNEQITDPQRLGRLDPGTKRRAANQGGRLVGQYNKNTGVTRLAIPLDFVTLTHEGGHALEHNRKTRDAVGELKLTHAEELITPPAPNVPAPQMATSGFSGIEIDADTQRRLVEFIEADASLKAMTQQVAQAKSQPRMFGRAGYNVRAYTQAQELAGKTRDKLVRRLGRSITDAVINDIQQQGIAADQVADYAARRFAQSGQPQPRQELQFTEDQLSEAWADWFQEYVIAPDSARRVAPDLYAEFEEALDGADPETLSVLEEIQDGYQKLIQANPEAAVRARLQSTVRPTNYEDFTKRLRERGVRRGLGEIITDWIYQTYTSYADNKHPMKVAVKVLLDLAEQNGRIKVGKNEKLLLKTVNDPYKRWRLAEHAKVHATQILQSGVILSGQIDSAGPSFREALVEAFGGESAGKWNEDVKEEFGAYLVARRVLAEFRRHDRGERDIQPDQLIGRQYWQQAKDNIESKNPRFAKAADMMYEFNRNVLTWKFENGFLDEKLYQELMQREDYAPLNRVMDEKGGMASLATARGRNKSGMIKRQLTSTRDFINPVEQIAQDVYASMARVELNGVIKGLDTVARAAGPGGGKIAERIPAFDMRGTRVDLREAIRGAAKDAGIDSQGYDNIMEAVDDVFDQDAAATIFRAAETNEGRDNIVYLWEDGKRVPILMGDNMIAKDIFDQFVAFGQDNTNFLLQMGVATTQALRFGVTKSPAYVVVNFLRDQVQTGILSPYYIPFVSGAKGLWQTSPGATIVGGAGVAAGIGGSLAAGSALLPAAGAVAATGAIYWGASRLGLTGSLARTSDGSDRYNAFAGQMGGVDSNLIQTSTAKRDIKSLRKQGFWSVPGGSVVGRTWNGFLRAMEVTEAATRVGHFDEAFKRARSDGMTDVEAAWEAAYAAHDVMDFSRRGARMHTVARLVAFLNASLQGMDAMRRTLTGERDAHKAIRDLATPYLKAIDGHPLTLAEKERLPNSAKAVIKMLGIGMIGAALWMLYEDDEEAEEFNDYMRATHWFFKMGGTWWRYPKPFELAFFSNAMEAALDRFVKDDPRAGTKFLHSLYHTLVPPHELQGMRFYYEIVTGKDTFSNRDIVSMDLAKLPPELQYNAYTSEFGKMVGSTLGLSPLQVDHFMQGAFATLGRDTLAMSDLVLPQVQQMTGGALPGVTIAPKAEKSFEDMMVLSRFMRRASRGALSTQYFWENMSQSGGHFTAAAEGYKALQEAGRIDPARSRDAKAFLENLKDNEKAYAYLVAEFEEKHKDLHPLHRARQVMRAAGGIRKELLSGDIVKQASTKKGRDLDVIRMTPSDMRKVNEILQDVQMREARNALIVTGVDGWKQKSIMPVDGLLKELRSVSPAVADEYEYRRRKGRNKVYSFAAVKDLWPKAKKRLLAEGPDAFLSDLAAEARAY